MALVREFRPTQRLGGQPPDGSCGLTKTLPGLCRSDRAGRVVRSHAL